MARKRSKAADKNAAPKGAVKPDAKPDAKGEDGARAKKKVLPPGSLPEMDPVPATDPAAHAAQVPPTAVDGGFISVELSDERGAASGRRQARIPITARVEVSSFYGVERAQAVSDVSLGGLFVETPHVLEIGDPVVLGFPDSGGKLRVSGRVRWVTPFGGVRDARPGMGIELVGVSDADRMRIFELLRGKR